MSVLTISKKRPFHFSADSDNNLIPAFQIVHFNCHNRKSVQIVPKASFAESTNAVVHRLGKNKRMKGPCIIFGIFSQRTRFLSDPGKPDEDTNSIVSNNGGIWWSNLQLMQFTLCERCKPNFYQSSMAFQFLLALQ